jgi:hypothetical protein
MESFGEIQAYLSRVQVIGSWDAWSLIPVVVLGLALVAVVVYYVWSLARRLRRPGGVDWEAEAGYSDSYSKTGGLPKNPRERFMARLQFSVIGIVLLLTGADALMSGRVSGRSHGRQYSSDGFSAYIAGGCLCLAGVLSGLVAIFADAEVLNRPLGRRRGPP